MIKNLYSLFSSLNLIKYISNEVRYVKRLFSLLIID